MICIQLNYVSQPYLYHLINQLIIKVINTYNMLINIQLKYQPENIHYSSDNLMICTQLNYVNQTCIYHLINRIIIPDSITDISG